jgi:hypothetical protein
VAIGIWGTARSDGFDYEAIAAIETEVDQLTAANPQYRRYIQSELAPRGYDFASYFGSDIYSSLAAIKKVMDPKGLMVPGLLNAAS